MRTMPSLWVYKDTMPVAPDLMPIMRQLGPCYLDGTKFVSVSGSAAEHTTPIFMPADPLPASPKATGADVPHTRTTVNVETDTSMVSLEPGELTTLHARPPPRGSAAIPGPPPLPKHMIDLTDEREKIRARNVEILKTLSSHPCSCGECGICHGIVIIPYTGVPGAVERAERARRIGA